jgi:hypothetical protein
MYVIVKCRLLEGRWLTTLVSDGMGMSVGWRRRFVQVMAGGVFDGAVLASP